MSISDEVLLSRDNLRLRAENAELKKRLKAIENSNKKLKADLNRNIVILLTMKRALLQCRNALIEMRNMKSAIYLGARENRFSAARFLSNINWKKPWINFAVIGLTVVLSGLWVGSILSIVAQSNEHTHSFVKLK